MSLKKRSEEQSNKSKVEVVLFTSVRGKGRPGDLVKVSKGFARNFLIPQGFADYATVSNVKKLEEKKAELATLDATNTKQAEQLKTTLEGKELKFFCKVRDNNNIYGSIQSRDIATELKKQGVDVNKSQVILPHPLKVLGRYDVTVVLYGDVDTTVHATLQSMADQAVGA